MPLESIFRDDNFLVKLISLSLTHLALMGLMVLN